MSFCNLNQGKGFFSYGSFFFFFNILLEILAYTVGKKERKNKMYM